ncbi:hypothetical protein FACS189487_09700 [Campylobacterota bacterium]|nr:hypothetical protein FACS189487_09700 [Campylobacterota bacterium]
MPKMSIACTKGTLVTLTTSASCSSLIPPPANATHIAYINALVPNLTVKYKIQKQGSAKVQEGTFMPMNASDGPHYGNNVKLDGAGKYKITFVVESPEKAGSYLLHVDKETGVDGRFWTKPIEVSWDFDFVPRKW